MIEPILFTLMAVMFIISNLNFLLVVLFLVSAYLLARQKTEGCCETTSCTSSTAQDLGGELSPMLRKLIAGNIVAKVGAFIVTVGVASLLKLVYDENLLSAAVTLGLTAVGAGLVAALGMALRKRAPLFSLILQGLAFGILYTDAYFATNVYELLSTQGAFIGVIALSVATTALAIWQRSQALASLAILGAFAAPFVTITYATSPATFFVYMLACTALVCGAATYRNWPVLNRLGLVTQSLSLYAFLSQQHEVTGTAMPLVFLSLIYGCYASVPLLTASCTTRGISRICDPVLTILTPIAFFLILAPLKLDLATVMPSISIYAGLFYSLLAYLTWRMQRHTLASVYGLIAGAALATGCLHLLPAALVYTSLGALSCGLVYMGVRQESRPAYQLGVGLYAWLLLSVIRLSPFSAEASIDLYAALLSASAASFYIGYILKQGLIFNLGWIPLTICASLVYQDLPEGYRAPIFASFCSLLALACLLRSRTPSETARNWWYTGVAILGIVVLKLFLVDLFHEAQITRIATFFGVGILLLAIGYFLPLPPKAKPKQAS